MNIHWLRYQKDKPFSILFKYPLSDFIPSSELSVHFTNLGNIMQEKLNGGAWVFKYLKKSDMLYQLKYIPPVHHAFFKTIRSSKEVQDCGPLPEDSEGD
ncbi:hypothetical protein PR048_002121 [Dryococelus australis]|uniref:Uncharacterized protein n=1 Tax=Dryococelus australis TaxID=614101 RepID=A0ABQ9IJC2_9NEOP|nr:hypothetical protein PR048_002121 [Dryococelus australis]